MQHTLVPGAKFESLTKEETRDVVREEFRRTVLQRVRAEGTKVLDATGSGTVDVYTCPVGFEFALRRIVLETDLGYIYVKTVPTGGGASSNIVPIEYLRSGDSLGRASHDVVFVGANQELWYVIPHVETWGDQQGPYIRNGETLQVAFRNCAALASNGVQCFAEGLQGRPPPVRG